MKTWLKLFFLQSIYVFDKFSALFALIVDCAHNIMCLWTQAFPVDQYLE